MGVVIIGNGPAGISAALYTVRAGIPTTIIGRDGGALMRTDEIENYYGFPEVITGKQLVENGKAQAARLGVTLVQGEVVSLGFEDSLVVKTTGGTYPANAVILATGAARQVPKIPGLAEYEGRGVSFCAVCDAFFFKGKDVAVLGHSDFAIHEAGELLPVVKSVTFVTNGEAPAPNLPAGVRVIQTPVAQFHGGETLETIRFADGQTLEVAGVFIAMGVAGSTALAKKLGAATEGNRIVVDAKMATNIPGLYAAGDCTGGFLQINKAVHEGAVAGSEAVKYLRAQKA